MFQTLDLTEVLLNLSGKEVKPVRTLTVQGKTVQFLCDSGADKTVLKDHVSGVDPSNGTIYVKSANGQLNQHRISKPVWIRDPTTGEAAQGSVVMCPTCPVNLLGRDMMMKLGISIIPTSIGMIAAGKGETAETMVHQDSGDLHYYWTLDLSASRPDQINCKLLAAAEEMLTTSHDIQPPEDLHVTLRFKTMPGPDEAYTDKVLKLGPQRITIKAIYTDGETMAGCSVILSEAAQQLFTGQTPHISLTKSGTAEWTDLASLVRQGESVGMWQQAGGGWETDVQHSIFRKKLGWVTHTTPQTHLQGSENDTAE